MTTYRALRLCLPHYVEAVGESGRPIAWYQWLRTDDVTASTPKRLYVAALVNGWNTATAPYLPRTEAEHRSYGKAARLIEERLAARHRGEYQEDEDGRLYVPYRRQSARG
jgi:hypothetical protein